MAIANKTVNGTVTVSAGQSIKIGAKDYTLKDAASFALDHYTALEDLHKKGLEHFKAIGDVLVGVWLNSDNNNHFNRQLEETGLLAIDKYTRRDAKKIAENWKLVQSLNKAGKLDSLGASAIVKRIRDHIAKTDKTQAAGKASAGNTSAGKGGRPAKAPTPETVPAHEKSEKALAAYVVAVLKKSGLNYNTFGQELVAAIAKK